MAAAADRPDPTLAVECGPPCLAAHLQAGVLFADILWLCVPDRGRPGPPATPVTVLVNDESLVMLVQVSICGIA